ncbi:MAG: lysylphosphatidylglycerol synthase domain-containing protein [Candidatus Neomarinimicrobiota bacterium]
MFDQPLKQSTDRPSDFKNRFLIPGLKLAGFAVVIYLIARYFRANVARINLPSWSEVNLSAVGIFIAALIAIQLLYSLLWMIFVRGFGYKISLSDTFVSTYYPVLTKYLPGKGWFQVGRIYLLKKAGVEAEAGLTINILEQIVVIYAGLLISTPLLIQLTRPMFVILILLVSTVLTISFLFYQSFFTKLFAQFGRLIKLNRTISLNQKIRPQIILLYMILYIANWILWGLLFKLGIDILDAGNSLSIGLAAGSFAFSSIIGFIIPIAPAGLGIREGALLVFLEKQVNPAALFNATIGIRLCTIIGEIIMFLIALLLKARTKND